MKNGKAWKRTFLKMYDKKLKKLDNSPKSMYIRYLIAKEVSFLLDVLEFEDYMEEEEEKVIKGFLP